MCMNILKQIKMFTRVSAVLAVSADSISAETAKRKICPLAQLLNNSNEIHKFKKNI